MSYNSNTKRTTQSAYVPRDICCKVCKDSGKDFSIYSSHWPKDKAGNVTCPTLLAIECRFCKKSGHTIRYCAELEAKNKYDAKMKYRLDQQQEQRRREIIKESAAKNARVNSKSSNSFAALDDSDDEELVFDATKKTKPGSLADGVRKQIAARVFKEEFPSLTPTNLKTELKTAPEFVISFAAITSTPAIDAPTPVKATSNMTQLHTQRDRKNAANEYAKAEQARLEHEAAIMVAELDASRAKFEAFVRTQEHMRQTGDDFANSSQLIHARAEIEDWEAEEDNSAWD
jgi:hypothetical protein